MELRHVIALLAAIAPIALVAFAPIAACASHDAELVGDTTSSAGPTTTPGDGSANAGPSPSADQGTCTVTKPGTAGLVLRGRLLLPNAAADGELLIDSSGMIACVGTSCTANAAAQTATVVNCIDAVISPGLINPHDHISYANTPPQDHGTERYEHRNDWRKGLRGHTKIKTKFTAPANVVRAAELRFLMSGTTSSASGGNGGERGLLRNLDSTVAQLEGLPMKVCDSQTFPLKDSSATVDNFPPQACSDYSASRDTAATVAKYDGYLPHIAEGVDDAAHLEMMCQDDEENDAEHFLLAKQTAVVHAIGVGANDIAKFRDTQTTLVWSPRSNISLYGNTAAVVEFDNLGVRIALGTDWLPSGSMNMLRELNCASWLNENYFNHHFSDRALWKMVTQNAAIAVGGQRVIGMLKEGFAGDVAVFRASGRADYRAIIDASPEDVVLVLRGGTALYGDSSLFGYRGLFAEACEDIDVCGIAKRACVEQDTGSTLADIQAATFDIYPLFFCRGEVPTMEPTCVPSRGETASAPSASVYNAITPEDQDGDGVKDIVDNCKTIFNPIRPLDGDAQPDTDGDGIGDACDKCPFEPGESCTPPSTGDLDGNGFD
ncbi:MAG: thrombospondin type 3 repeat-containing protein [Polyangiaceae bacterium]|nr:thrombospondin type 3 repeat-containing protein [Polyangiaceae bacterium]